MSWGLRLLLGAACAAILAYTGYFFLGEWGTYQNHQEAERAARLAEEQRLSELASVPRPDCLESLRHFYTPGLRTDQQRLFNEKCQRLGVIDQADVTEAMKSSFTAQ